LDIEKINGYGQQLVERLIEFGIQGSGPLITPTHNACCWPAE
jgi:hypothetical protein